MRKPHATDIYAPDMPVHPNGSRLWPAVLRPVEQDDEQRLRGRYERWAKPLLDRALGALLIVAAAPLMVVIALAVRIRLGSPVLVRQPRVGQGGLVFGMLKFRTMEPDRRRIRWPFHGQDRRQTHKSPQDPRLVPLGRFLRRWSLDEVPQLFHVLSGRMSLVGPRPELVSIVEQYEPWQHRRHAVKPGLTGLWQITQRDRVMHECTAVDLAYLERISLRTDLAILIRTLPAALGSRPGF